MFGWVLETLLPTLCLFCFCFFSYIQAILKLPFFLLASLAAVISFPSTAAFLLKLGHQLCGVMHDGSDADVGHTQPVEKARQSRCDLIGLYAVTVTGPVFRLGTF